MRNRKDTSMSSGRKFIGLDVHKDSIAIAIAEADMKEVRFFGTVCGTTEALHAALKKIGRDGSELCVCYESGPTGFVLYRFLVKPGIECLVISPASMPRQPNDRLKTDRRDAET